jgi:hypothetical protein
MKKKWGDESNGSGEMVLTRDIMSTRNCRLTTSNSATRQNPGILDPTKEDANKIQKGVTKKCEDRTEKIEHYEEGKGEGQYFSIGGLQYLLHSIAIMSLPHYLVG